MAFKLTQKPTFVAKVTVDIPNSKGSFDRSEFKAEFLRPNMNELEELKKLPQKEVQERVLVNYEDLLDDDNAQVPFNEDNLEVLLLIPQALSGLTEAFWGSLFKAKEKN